MNDKYNIMRDYIIREDNLPEIYTREENEKLLDSYKILEENYAYITEAMKKESFKLKNPHCSVFKELIYKKKVIGFTTYLTEDILADVSLNAIYILPEFRGNYLLYDDLRIFLENDVKISIYEPTRQIINILINYGFAEKLENNLVASAIGLEVPYKSYICNVKEFRLDPEDVTSSYLYDSNICATLMLYDISSPNTNIIYYSKLLKSDIKNYNADKKRRRLNKRYFNKIKTTMHENNNEFAEIIRKLKENLPHRDYDINDFVGKNGKLTPLLSELVDENYMTRQKAEQIQAQIQEEYDNKEILPRSLRKRFLYLSLNEDDDRDYFDYEHNPGTCPYCYENVSLSDIICNNCGYNLQYKVDINEFMKDEEINELLKDVFEKLAEDKNNQARTTDENINKEEDKYLSPREKSLQKKDKDYQWTYSITKILLEMSEFNSLEKSISYTTLFRYFDHIDLKNYLIENELITEYITEDNYDLILPNLTVANLKKILKKQKLRQSGKKDELINRIVEEGDLSKIKIRQYTRFESNYVISKKGMEYIQENLYIVEYEMYLNKFEFEEFDKYYQEHKKDEDLYTIIFNFQSLHEINCMENFNNEYYHDILRMKRMLLNDTRPDSKEAFINELKIFLFYLNNDNIKLYQGIINRVEDENRRQLRKSYDKSYNINQLLEEIYDITSYHKRYSLNNSIRIFKQLVTDRLLSEIRKEVLALPTQ